ncbi:MAG: hypothetical protein ACYCX8_09365 [Acidimicrobiales bacterium]
MGKHIHATPGLSLFVLEQSGKAVAASYLTVIPNLTRSPTGTPQLRPAAPER